jgi:prefoldin subunit 5
MELVALAVSVFLSIAGATAVLSYRLGRLENAISGLTKQIDRLADRIDKLEERIASVERRIDSSSYVPKERSL